VKTEIKLASALLAVAFLVLSCTKYDENTVSQAVKPALMEETGVVADSASRAPLSSQAFTAKKLASMAGINQAISLPPVNRERYARHDENGVKRVAEAPVSTFSVDVDTASYSNIRRMLMREGRLPPPAAVRVEEMVNYFSYDYPQPSSTGQPFAINTEVASAPWDSSRHIMRIGLKGFAPDPADRPSANLVFLIDVSGSMRSAEKLPMVKSALQLLVNQMKDDDRIALVVYAGAAGVVLESTPVSEKATILAAISALQSGGSTHGSAGIHLAYSVAEKHFVKDGINRVLIASDGDMNVGITSTDELIDLIESKRQGGIALTTLGFGTGNFNDALMEQLADAGNGNASYIDNLKEAQKVLVSELQSTLLTIAKDVKIQVEFNPAMVQEYRLIGYENRLLEREDFTNDRVDAGDIGAGHTVTALYELVLEGSDSPMILPLRYKSESPEERTVLHTDEIAFIRLRYKQPQESISREVVHAVSSQSVLATFDLATEDFRFATAVASFGQYLKRSKYGIDSRTDVVADVPAISPLTDTLGILRASRGVDKNGYRSEFISLVELTTGLSAHSEVGG